MDREQARRILMTYRLGEYAPPGSDLAAALAAADLDPELGAWLDAQLHFDRGVRNRVRSVAPPEHLRASLIGRHSGAAGKPLWNFPVGWGLAAVLALMVVGAAWLLVGSGSRVPVTRTQARSATPDSFRQDMATLLSDGTYSLQAHSSSLRELRQFIASKGGAANAPIPSSLEALNTFGCQVFSWNGRQATLICFSGGGLGFVHLIVLEGSLPGSNGEAPRLAEASGWNTALWEKSGRTYLLCARGSNAALTGLLGG